MKRVILGIAVAVCFHAHAGNGLPENEGRVGSCDTVRRFGNVGGDLIAMRKGVDENSIVLEVAGFGITLGQMDEGPGQLGKSRRAIFSICRPPGRSMPPKTLPESMSGSTVAGGFFSRPDFP